jgi:Glycosyl transferase family group 2
VKGEAGARDAVSVVVPFAGDDEDARATISALQRINFGPDDEAILVDNSAGRVLAHTDLRAPMRVVSAPAQPSSYYARNRGAAEARNDWLLYMDSDCIPPPRLIDDYFSEPIGDDVGAVAGAVLPADVPMGVIARHKSFRRHLDQGKWMQAERPWAGTANLLVRKAAWNDVGGFAESIRSCGDIDFSWRLLATGWRLVYQPKATMRHVHRDTLRAHACQQIRYGGGHTWMQRRYPGTKMSRPLIKQLPLSAAGALRRAAVGDWEWSLFHLLDAMTAVMISAGKLRGNRVAGPDGEADIAVVADSWPTMGIHDSLSGVSANGARVQLEARRRPTRILRNGPHNLLSHYREDDSLLDVVEGLAWLLTHRPKEAARHIRRARGAVRGAARLARLAPAARRVARSGARSVRALDPASTDDARALAELAAATYDE